MLRRICLALVVALAFGAGGPARADQVDDLSRVLDLPWLARILSLEGQDYGRSLESELFPARGGARWTRMVTAIHDPGRIEGDVLAGLRRELAGRAGVLDPAIAYFDTEPGRRIVRLEIAAREALLDDEVEQGAEAAHAAQLAEGSARPALIERLIAASDLIEQNVAGALNSNMAFYEGVEAGGAPELLLPEGGVTADLWSQEPAIRQETIRWLNTYMTLAYEGLTDKELEGYIEFSLSAAGQDLNRALFAAFDSTFDRISRELGQAAAQILKGQDI